eukprot:COSAG05_NODE_1074_length_5958_cov_5.368152_5_plen_60_part_00
MLVCMGERDHPQPAARRLVLVMHSHMMAEKRNNIEAAKEEASLAILVSHTRLFCAWRSM